MKRDGVSRGRVAAPVRRGVAAGGLGLLCCFLALASGLATLSCGAPPWRLGAPLDGVPSIPWHRGYLSPDEAHAAAAGTRERRQRALEISALLVLQGYDRLTRDERARLVELLLARAQLFHDRGRAIPESRDLETASVLDPAKGVVLAPTRARAAVEAGDAWKAIGAAEEARACYARAVALGGAAPAGVAPTASPASVGAPPPAAAVAPRALPADVDAWVFEPPALSVRLLPLAAAFPGLADGSPRAMHWAELLLEEDPASPDVLELVALIFGRARRHGGTARMLMELTYHSPDRSVGLARGARVWEQLGRPREACAQWIRAARWRDDPEDPSWRRALACAYRDPGAGDWREIRDYIVGRAAPERRETIAAELEAVVAPADARVGDAGGAGTAPVDGGAGDGGAGRD